MKEAGAKYQATPGGKRAHCKRQNRYEARLKNLTHQSPGETTPTATVPSLPAMSTIPVAPIGRTRTWSHGEESESYRCSWCGQPARYLRHETLARCRTRRPSQA